MVGNRSDQFETLLQKVFSPVDPPVALAGRLEGGLGSIVDRAAYELETWELSAMRNPRHWFHPVGAVVVGGAAAVGLVIVQTRIRRHHRRKHSKNFIDLTVRTLEDFAGHTVDSARRLWR